MPYSAFTIIALVVLVVMNFDIFRSKKTSDSLIAIKYYKVFISVVAAFFVVDTLWGIFESNKQAVALYIDTIVYFVLMGATIFFWTIYTVRLLNVNKLFSRILELVGLAFFIAEIVLLIVNIFQPVLFRVNLETCVYESYLARNIMLYFQIGMYFLVTLYTVLSMVIDRRFKRRDFAIAVFSVVTASFIVVQLFDPYLPLYSIGMLVGACILSSFVINDIREEYRSELEESKKKVKVQEAALGNALLLAHTDPLTGVLNKHAYVELEDEIDALINKKEMDEFALVVCDLNGLKVINDTYGHDKGDQYIKDSVEAIKKFFGEEHLYRFGGDEFVVVLTGDLYKKRNVMLSSFNNYIDSCLDKNLPIISAGMSIYKKGEDNTFRSIFARADKSMYARKEMLKEHSK